MYVIYCSTHHASSWDTIVRLPWHFFVPAQKCARTFLNVPVHFKMCRHKWQKWLKRHKSKIRWNKPHKRHKRHNFTTLIVRRNITDNINGTNGTKSADTNMCGHIFVPHQKVSPIADRFQLACWCCPLFVPFLGFLAHNPGS